jgi:hypothetical protein
LKRHLRHRYRQRTIDKDHVETQPCFVIDNAVFRRCLIEEKKNGLPHDEQRQPN